VTAASSTRPTRRLIALLCAAAGLLAACDTGDGTTLQDPVTSTTLPPVDTTPLETVPLDDPTLDGEPELDTVAPLPSVADGESGETLPEGAPGGFRVFTPWADGGPIDLRYTCDGANASPSISWSEIPNGAAEIAVSLVDESNLSNGRPFIHWVMAGIDPSVESLGEAEVPVGAVRGLNFFGDVGYTGPCPDPGTTHTFTLTVFALNQQLELADGTPAAEMLDVIGTVAAGTASSTGLSTR
jgi:Raf kinase inhibitor-like YbhB/YbcL family protein